MNWVGRQFERAAYHVAPRWLARRRHEQRLVRDPEYQLLAHALARSIAMARGYDVGRLAGNGALGGATSADAEILNDLPALRNESRRLNRLESIAAGLTHSFVANVSGTGPRAQPTTGNPAWDAACDAVWAERRDQLCPADDLEWGPLVSLIDRKKHEDGELLVNARKFGPDAPVVLELVEADRLATPPGKAGFGNIRDGVVRNGLDVVTGYYIRRGHPGDVGLPKPADREYVYRPKRYCRHCRGITRPGQSRGVPLFHAVLRDLADLDLLLLAALKRTQIAACLAAFLTTDAGIEELLQSVQVKGAREGAAWGKVLEQTLEPGMIMRLLPGEQLQTLVPSFPTPEFVPFIIVLARKIGAALGVSWQTVLRDFSDSTYSSARTDLLETRQTWLLHRARLASDLTWIRNQVLVDALLRGDPRLRGVPAYAFLQVKWIFDPWRWVDPMKEVSAIVLELAARLRSYEDVWLLMGEDPDEMRRKLAADDAWRAQNNIPGPEQLRSLVAALTPLASDEPTTPPPGGRAAA